MGDRRQETEEERQEAGDRIQETEEGRQEPEDMRQETGDSRHVHCTLYCSVFFKGTVCQDFRFPIFLQPMRPLIDKLKY